MDADQRRVIDNYKGLLKHALKLGILFPTSVELLSEYRKQNDISEDMHILALKELNVSKDQYETALEMGEEEVPDASYGPPKCQQVYYIAETYRRPAFWNGLIVAPHLRQWYELDGDKKDVFWREKEERKASWLELFFDLVFVTIVYSLSETITEHYLSIAEFVILYSAYWRVWVGLTSYSTRYEHHDWWHPVVYCSTMAGLLGMNIMMSDAYFTLFSDSKLKIKENQVSAGVGFSAFFIISSLPLFVQYLFATWSELTGRSRIIKNSKRSVNYHPLLMAAALFVSFIPWIVSASTSAYYTLPYWVVGLIFMEICSIIIEGVNYVTAPMCVEHWGERLCLFLMVHLGESMFAVATDFSSVADRPEPYVACLFGLIIPFAFRRVHFEVEGTEPKEPHALRRSRWFAQLYVTGYWILCMSVIAYALGFKGLQKVNLYTLQGGTLLVNKFSQVHNTNNWLPTSYYELTHPQLINCTTYMETHLKRHLLGEMTELVSLTSLASSTPTSSKKYEYYMENYMVGNTSCYSVMEMEKYAYFFRQSQIIFCGSLAIVIGVVACLGLMSRTKESTEELYVVPKSQAWRLGTRILFIFLLVIIPLISISQSVIDPLETICIGGGYFFIWAILESFFVLKKKRIVMLPKPDENYEMM